MADETINRPPQAPDATDGQAGRGTRGTDAAAGTAGAGAVPATAKQRRRTPKKLFIALCAAVVLVAAGAGYAAALLIQRTGLATEAPARSEPGAEAGGDSAAAPPVAPADAAAGAQPPANDFIYYDFEPIVVNLDEPRLARYIRVTITLAIRKENASAVVALLEKRKPELKNWLTVFFASCTLEEVRGAPNLNRLRREILDNFSQQLWPEQKPLINHVLFKEFAVQ